MQAGNFGGPTFRLNFLMKFSQKMPLYFFYTMMQKVKNDQKLKSKGTALKELRSLSPLHSARQKEWAVMQPLHWNGWQRCLPRKLAGVTQPQSMSFAAVCVPRRSRRRLYHKKLQPSLGFVEARLDHKKTLFFFFLTSIALSLSLSLLPFRFHLLFALNCCWQKDAISYHWYRSRIQNRSFWICETITRWPFQKLQKIVYRKICGAYTFKTDHWFAPTLQKIESVVKSCLIHI